MKKSLILLLCLFFAAIYFSQTPSLTWAKQLGSTNNEEGFSIVTDNAGNVYTAGTFSGTADLDPGPAVFNLISAGSEDVYITKFNSSGNFVWARQLGGPGDDMAHAIACDASGNLVITGYFEGAAVFSPGAPATTLTAAGDNDIYVAQLSSSGTFNWARQIGGGGIDAGYGIACNSAMVYATGSFSGTVDFDPGAGTFTLSAAQQGAFVLQLDNSGNFMMAQKLAGNSAVDLGKSIAVDGGGNIYTTGNFSGTNDFDPGAGTFTLASMGGSDIFVTKLNGSGSLVWARRMGGTGLNDIPASVMVDSTGNVYLAGIFDGTADFDPGPGSYNLTSFGLEDVFVAKLNSNGNFTFAKQLGGNGSDLAGSMSPDHLGNIYTAGYFSGTCDFDPGPATYSLSSVNGGNDIFVNKLDNSGNFIWTKQSGGTGPDQCNAVHVDINQNIYCTGSFIMNVDFDPAPATFTLDAPSDFDAYVFKWFQCASMTSSIVSQIDPSCYGAPNGGATITAAGGTGITYLWAPSGGTTNIGFPLADGLYTVTAINSCGNFVKQPVTIMQPPAVTLSLTTNPDPVCANFDATLTANFSGGTSPYLNIAWLPAGSGSVAVVNHSVSTQYSLSLLDFNNCLFDTVFTLNVDPCTGFKEHKVNNAIVRVFPNPATDQLTVQMSAIDGEKEITLTDVSGKILQKHSVSTTEHILDVSVLEQGIYLLKIKTRDGIRVVKVMNGF